MDTTDYHVSESSQVKDHDFYFNFYSSLQNQQVAVSIRAFIKAKKTAN